MKNHKTLLVRVLLAVLVFSCCGNALAQGQTDQRGILIGRVLAEIQRALTKTQRDLAFEKLPPLQSVTLDLVAEAKREVGAKINLYIVSFGKKWEKDRSQEIELSLKPPSPNVAVKTGKVPSVSDELVSAIESAALGVRNASANANVPLQPSELKVVLSFVVKGDTSGGAKFEIVPVTVDLSGDLANSATQKITVVFQSPASKGK